MNDVVVLGAGVAGLACARALVAAGLRVAIVEARPRVGGRILTLHPPDAPLPVELGAEFVHGAPQAMMALLAEAGLDAVPVQQSFWLAAPDGLRPAPRFEPDLDAVLGAMNAARVPDRSFAAFLAAWQRRHPGEERAARRARDFVEGFHAADPARASERALAHETEAAERGGGDQDYRLPGGYGGVPSWLRAGLGDAALHLETVVREVRWSPGRVAVHAHRGRNEELVLHARAAVVALPLALLQARAGEPGAVAFSPEPAGKREALGRLATGDARRIVLHFAEPFWEDASLLAPGVSADASSLGFLEMPASPVPIWWTSAPLRAPVLTGWLGGPRATRLAGASDALLRDLALDALAAGLRVPRAAVTAALRGAYSHDWATDPFARGAYSYALVGAGDARRRLGEPVEGTLFWAGEATHADGAAGTVHGALASGWRAADELLATGWTIG